MKKFIITALLTVVLPSVKSQFSINYSAGYGFYKMNKMKGFMSYALQTGLASGNLPLHTKLVDNFPAHIMQMQVINLARTKPDLSSHI
jgi:hypothetical protein